MDVVRSDKAKGKSCTLILYPSHTELSSQAQALKPKLLGLSSLRAIEHESLVQVSTNGSANRLIKVN